MKTDGLDHGRAFGHGLTLLRSSAGCVRSADACAKATTDQVLKPIEAVVQDWPGAIEKGIATANACNLPICGAR